MTLIQTAMFLTGCWINQSKLTTELYKREKCIQCLSREKMQPVRSAWNYYALLITCVIKPSKSNHGWWIVYKTLSLFWGCTTWAILFKSLEIPLKTFKFSFAHNYYNEQISVQHCHFIAINCSKTVQTLLTILAFKLLNFRLNFKDTALDRSSWT